MLKNKMCVTRWVLAMVALHVAVVHSWDIAIGVKDQLIFYTNGIKTSSINLISQNPTSLVYDELHNMMLYVDKQNNNDAVCGYDLSSKDNKCFIKRNGRNIQGLAFDPVTEIIFFTDTKEKSINWFSLKPGCNNNVYGNLLIKSDSKIPADIAVDSCGGYIYWTYKEGPIERARFNGSERKVEFSNSWSQFSIFVDQQIKKLFYFDVCNSCTNNNGWLQYRRFNDSSTYVYLSNFYGTQCRSKVLTVSKDYVYWKNSTGSYDSIWQLSKTAKQYVEPKEINKIYDDKILGIVANYKIQDQAKGLEDCEALSSLIPKLTVPPGYTGEQTNVSACDNYCFNGNCSFNGEGIPKCRCNAGYSGQRCEINVCYNYCLNDGECSLNEEDEPTCQCAGDHAGVRCETGTSDTPPSTPPTNALAKRNLTINDLLSSWRKSNSKMYLTVEV
ncbi:hypothetical protein PYW08_013244 [Mythimna loreyi]|uniref:Uncharacterized protein n=1 Tax=Mythimna loreyi TaxID=667449 RepID=A0ACC2QF14_9NEOP|nr:hypothetical protein PYW08_013244 [Mythimna loreyi]